MATPWSLAAIATGTLLFAGLTAAEAQPRRPRASQILAARLAGLPDPVRAPPLLLAPHRDETLGHSVGRPVRRLDMTASTGEGVAGARVEQVPGGGQVGFALAVGHGHAHAGGEIEGGRVLSTQFRSGGKHLALAVALDDETLAKLGLSPLTLALRSGKR